MALRIVLEQSLEQQEEKEDKESREGESGKYGVGLDVSDIDSDQSLAGLVTHFGTATKNDHMSYAINVLIQYQVKKSSKKWTKIIKFRL